jgi:hypothetical protein
VIATLVRAGAFDFVSSEGGLSAGVAAKAHPPTGPFRAKPLAAIGAARVIPGAALRGIKK